MGEKLPGIIWRKEMRNKVLMGVVCLFLFAGIAFGQQAKKEGWWIKAIAKNPESGMIVFYAGATGASYGFWRAWNPGENVEFDVPEEFQTSPTFYVLAQTTSGRKCGFCLMYKSKGVKRIEFELEQDHQAKQSDEDKGCD
jgi:hypothetical protein